ncbi:hypothetical protein ACQ4PT_012891 [Festuca glaucescens]
MAPPNPPPLPVLEGHDAPSWVLLDLSGYISRCPNTTFASSITSTGQRIEVTFSIARPPDVSHFCVHRPGLAPDDFTGAPKVMATEADLVLFRLPFSRYARPGMVHCDYFLYRAHPQHPSLHLLPYPERTFLDCEVAILRCSDDGYAIAALRNTLYNVPLKEDGTLEEPLEFKLSLYRSTEGQWSSRTLSVAEPLRDKVCPVEETEQYHATTKVITLGGPGGTVGWVDLWRGILVCNVLDENPVLRDVPLPPPSRGNWLLYHKHPSYAYRDITVSLSRDCINYIEMEIGLPRNDPPDPPSASYLEWFHRKPRREVRDGWKATTWSMPIPIGSWKDWIPGCTISSDEIVVQPTEEAALLSVLVGSCPTMSMDDDVVYLLSKEAVTAVDLRNKTLRGVGKLVAGKDFASMHNWTSEISRYLNLNMAAAKREEDKQSDKLKEAGK